MPPSGMFESFRQLTNVFDSDEATPCSGAKNHYLDITEKATQDVLRTWLACQAPIVEVNSSGGRGQRQRPARLAISIQSCGCRSPGDGGAGDGAPRSSRSRIVRDGPFATNACMSCHPGAGGDAIDLTSDDKAYATLVSEQEGHLQRQALRHARRSEQVVPVSTSSPRMSRAATSDRMPLGGPMSDDGDQVRRRLDQGRGQARVGRQVAPSLSTGLDAGV